MITSATSQSPVPLHCPSCHTRLMDIMLAAGSRVDIKCRRCDVMVIVLSAAPCPDIGTDETTDAETYRAKVVTPA